MKAFLLSLGLVLALSLAPALAADFTHPTGKVSLTIPDDWKTTAEEDVLLAEAPEGVAISLVFQMVAAESVESAVLAAQEVVEKKLGPLTIVSQNDFELNGMKTFTVDATAKEGTISADLAVIVTPAGKILLLYYFGSAEDEKKHEEVLLGIVKSIRPVPEKASAPAASSEEPSSSGAEPKGEE